MLRGKMWYFYQKMIIFWLKNTTVMVQNSKIRLIEVEAKRNYDLKELKKVFKFLSHSRALKRQEQTVT